ATNASYTATRTGGTFSFQPADRPPSTAVSDGLLSSGDGTSFDGASPSRSAVLISAVGGTTPAVGLAFGTRWPARSSLQRARYSPAPSAAAAEPASRSGPT